MKPEKRGRHENILTCFLSIL